ncbi:MAG: S1 RNA-binding domain-containing protein [Candidatus Omnitrophica bacterium]|nr:S1 RNA-binding domain-containing protein [Candidatus Omnitrophota bacterium]
MQESGFKINDSVEVQVTKIHSFGAIATLPDGKRGLIHISQVSDDFVKDINSYLKVGDKLQAWIKKIASDGKIDLTLRKKKKPAVVPEVREKEFKFSHLEEKMNEFLSRAENKTEEKTV